MNTSGTNGNHYPSPPPGALGELLDAEAWNDPTLLQAIDTLELDESHLENLLVAVRRFNGPVHVQQEDGSVYVDSNFYLKRTLEQVPGYLDGARSAGLSEEQANELMIHIFESNPYDFSSNSNETTLWAYGEIFKQKAAKGEVVQSEEHEAIKALIELSGEAGVMDSAAYAHLYAARLGLSVDQAVEIIAPLPAADGSMSGYTFGSFNDALKSLIPAPVDPEAVTQVFTALNGERPYFRQHLYSAFEHLVIFHTLTKGRTPQHLLEDLMHRIANGQDLEDAMPDIAKRGSKPALAADNPGAELVDRPAEIEQYFLPKTGELEVLGLPYRTRRSLGEGLEDLSKIAKANMRDNIEVGEGMWVFDDESETWYSLGGKLEVTPGHVRNNFIPYDISSLSKNPWLFHVHPDAYSIMIAAPRGSGPQPEALDDDVTAFVSATPSRADYEVARHLLGRAIEQHQPRAFIVHKLGITEYSYPQDATQLADMAMNARAIRDRTILAYDWHDALWPRRLSEREVVVQLIGNLASRLPYGFKLELVDAEDLSRPNPPSQVS